MKEFILGCDGAGIHLKSRLADFLRLKSIPYKDVGVSTADDPTIYPDIAKHVVEEIKNSNYLKDGILVCGTGLGMAITANKFPRIYAGVCHDIFSAERLRLSNNGNVICFGARVIGSELAIKILAEWLDREFQEGASSPKLRRISEFEAMNFQGFAKEGDGGCGLLRKA